MASDTAPDPARLVPFTVGDWLVEPKACRLSRGDTVVKLRPQLTDLLVCLSRRAGEVVLRDEILAEVWPAQYIAESGLSRCVAELRQSLQDDAQEPRFIETFPKRGYRLIAAVVWLKPTEPVDAMPVAAMAADATPVEGTPIEAAPVPAELGADPAVGAAVSGEAVFESADAPGGDRPPVGRRRRVWAAAVVGSLAIGIVAVAMLARSPASVLTGRDTLLLAFENKTGDGVFDETIPLAMSIQLEQSPYLRLLSPARVQETLRMMQRPPDSPMTRTVGMEVCDRVGARALIVTSIARLGSQYAIGLEAVACGSGRVLARQQVTTDRKERILEGLQRAAAEIRRAVGESADSLERYNVPIVEATTFSLDALRALRRGDVARDRGEVHLAVSQYREAVSLDPDFALAYSHLGTVLALLGSEADTGVAFEKAYALRQRITLPERLEIEASYHRIVTGERTKVVQALELLARTYPGRAMPHRGLAVEHMQAGRFDAALAESLEALRLEPDSPLNLTAVGMAYLYLNRIADARAAAERGVVLGGVNRWLHVILFECGLAAADRELLARERAWAAEHADVAAPPFLEIEAEEAMNRGRLQAALEFLRQRHALARSAGNPLTASLAELRMARFEALAGRRPEALRRLDDEMRRGLAPQLRIDAVKVAVSAGDIDRAARLLDEVERASGFGAAQQTATFVRAYRAAIDARQGRIEQALSRLAPLEPIELGYSYEFIPLFERAKALALAGNWMMARAAFEKILAHPTLGAGRHLLPFAQLELARTLARAGDVAGSRRTYEQFFERWRQADPDLPLLLQARREYEVLAK
jgi:DNA-binding winged helix-turn-helix (wHTH) protein/tetratricopeptide (TPR) repeat protein